MLCNCLLVQQTLLMPIACCVVWGVWGGERQLTGWYVLKQRKIKSATGLQHIHCRLSVIVWHCVLCKAPAYLRQLFNLNFSLLGSPFSTQLPEATRHYWALSIMGSSVWNSLPSDLHSIPLDLSSSFYKLFKTVLFDWACVISTSE